MADERVWRRFPKTAQEFEAAFPDEAACRQLLIELRWGGQPVCVRCGSDQTWELANGRFECRSCGYQMSVTAGTPLQGTRKPLRLWFRALWEMTARKNGISAKDLQRILGFGSYETAWVWMQKLRRCMVRQGRPQLEGHIVVDDAYFGSQGERSGRPGEQKAAIFVAAEDGGRIRLEHAPDLSTRSVRSFVERNVSGGSSVTTDGYSTYNRSTIRGRGHHQIIVKRLPRGSGDPIQNAHHAISLVRRFWIGTYHGAVSRKHFQAYLDEFEFRHNRRKTRGVGRIVARVLEVLVHSQPITYRTIVKSTPHPRFETT